ncbi:MAG TPA: hypothetical protein VFP84_08730, partial [Kofleriaceae bacterium]|nr:hypothetical protein [Kofleriaceae bacterium]
MPAPSDPLHRSVDPAPRPFGRTFWLCIGAATLLALLGVVFLLVMPSHQLRPRHPGSPPAAEAPAAAPAAPAAPTPHP